MFLCPSNHMPSLDYTDRNVFIIYVREIYLLDNRQQQYIEHIIPVQPRLESVSKPPDFGRSP